MKRSFDLGQHLGVADFSDDGLTLLAWRTEHLGKDSCAVCKRQGNTRKWFEVRAEQCIRELVGEATSVAYEKISVLRVHKGAGDAHCYGGLQHSLVRQATLHDVPLLPIELNTWKRHIGAKCVPKQSYVDRVNAITGLALTLRDEDTAAAIGVGLLAFCPDLSALEVVRS